jgi:hypothetical protein
MRIRKPLLLAVFVVAVVALGVVPASAQLMRESTCTNAEGATAVTWDCNFNVKDYVTGTPVVLAINYTCTGACGPVMSFGLRDNGFTPAGVSGHLAGGRRTLSGLDLTFVFDTLKKAGAGATGNAHFVMNLMMSDGAGGIVAMPLPIDVHLNESKK